MSTFRTPVGPQPSQVYWRRRLVVLLGLLAVVVVVVLIVVRPGAGTPKPPAASNSSSAPPTGGSTNPADAEACDPAKVTVEATTDAEGYDAGQNPVLSFSLKSVEQQPCTFAAGSDVQEFRITSGSELIWSSKDCQEAPVAATALLLPGVPKAGSPLPWDRTRSAPDTCDVARDPVIAGGASYHLEVVVNGVTSTETRQFLLY